MIRRERRELRSSILSMTATSLAGFSSCMELACEAPRILIAVEPALLADVLGRVVERKGLEVVMPPPDGFAGDEGVFDMALISSSLPPGASAPHVIRVPGSTGAARSSRPPVLD